MITSSHNSRSFSDWRKINCSETVIIYYGFGLLAALELVIKSKKNIDDNSPDAQNDTVQGTVTAYTHVLNSGGTANAPTGGYQNIDLVNGNGAQPYYSQWTYGADTSGDGLKGIYEYIKDLTLL